MATLMYQPDEVDGISLNGVINVVREWLGSAAGKSVRSDVVPAFPFCDLAHLPGHSLAESAGETFGYIGVLGFFSPQVVPETRDKDSVH